MMGRQCLISLAIAILISLVASEEEWALRVEDILADELIAAYPASVEFEDDVTRQEFVYRDMPMGITYCTTPLMAPDGVVAKYCPADLVSVSNTVIGRDVLHDSFQDELLVANEVFVRFPVGVDIASLEPEITSNNAQMVNPDDVVYELGETLGNPTFVNIQNATITFPVNSGELGIVSVGVRLVNPANTTQDYTSTFNIHVLGVLVTTVVESIGTYDEASQVLTFDSLESRNAQPQTVMRTQIFTQSAQPGAVNPSAADAIIQLVPGTDWGQVAFDPTCSGTTAVENADGTFTLPDPNCQVGVTPTGDALVVNYTQDRVGLEGVLGVNVEIPGMSVEGTPTDAIFTFESTEENWRDAPPLVNRAVYANPFNSWGGGLVTVSGYNLPLPQSISYTLRLENNEGANSVQCYELPGGRAAVEDQKEQMVVFVCGMGQGENMNLVMFKVIDYDRAIPFQLPEGALLAEYGPQLEPPPDTTQVDVRYVIDQENLAGYYQRVDFYIEQLAALGERTAFFDAYTTGAFDLGGEPAPTASPVPEETAPPPQETAPPPQETAPPPQETSPPSNPEGGRLQARWLWNRQKQESLRQRTDPNVPDPTPPPSQNQLTLDYSYWVPAGLEDELLRTIELNIDSGSFLENTGQPISIDGTSVEPSALERSLPTASTIIIATTVAIVVAFGVAGQTASVIVGSQIAATVSNLAAPIALPTTSAATTVQTVITPVQMLSARGLVNVPLTDPFITVAARSSGYLLRVPPPWDTGTSGSSTRILDTDRELLTVSNFYDALGGTNFQEVFIGQLFYIALSMVVAITIHVTLHLSLRNRSERAHRICMRVLTKIEVMFFNLLHLGIFISVSEILNNRETADVYLILAAVIILFLFGVGYPVLVWYILRSHVWPRLNKHWLKDYFQRFILRPWFCGRSENEDLDETWAQDGEERRFAYVARRHRRFAGRWQPDGPRDNETAMFGTFFMSYKGEFFYYFLVELTILAVEGILIGALPGNGKVQAALILALESLSLLLVVWLLPFNDILENLVNIIIASFNVAIAAIQLALADVTPGSSQAVRLSEVMLILNITVIAIAIAFVLWCIIEGLWYSGITCQTIGDILCCRTKDKDDESSVDSYYYSSRNQQQKPEYALYYVERDRQEATEIAGPVVTVAAVEGATLSRPPRKGLRQVNHNDEKMG